MLPSPDNCVKKRKQAKVTKMDIRNHKRNEPNF
jgi:hypothetical protein